jgi:3',5'-cyclic AMP phosphodiesterase CpdA
MPLRILHTADNHIGLSFGRYPDDVRDRLLNERFESLERLVATANTRQAHFFVVAGDLFDKQNVTKTQIDRTVKILAEFEGENVLVLAGNHDFHEGSDNKLWKWFRSAAEGTRVLALTDQGVQEFKSDDYHVRFYYCPCPSKHGKDHMIGWIADEEKSGDCLHIGLAHGNVEGLGLDADQRYFNMTEPDLKAAGLHTWLLGHIHVPAPAPGTTGRPLYFMPGIHTPDSVKCTHPGHAWWIELDPDGTCRHEQLTSGAIRFVRLNRVMDKPEDVEALRQTCGSLSAPATILNLQLSGRLSEEGMAALQLLLADLKTAFLDLSHELDIAPLLDKAGIAKRFPEGTLPNALLQALLTDESNPGDAHLALELIETLQNS